MHPRNYAAGMERRAPRSVFAWAQDARVPVFLHYLALAVGAVVLLYVSRNQWFAGDEWSFIPQRGNPGSSPGIFLPHNEHWVTVPVLVYRTLFGLFGARSYFPYISVLIALHLLATHLLYRIICRTGATPWMALGLSSVFLTLGAGSENLLWAFQIAFVGAFAFGLLYVLLIDHSSAALGRRDMTAWIAAFAALMCSGVGLTMVLIGAVSVLLRRGARMSLLVSGPPIIAYAVWFAAIGHQGLDNTPVTRDTFVHMPSFIWNGLAATLEDISGFSNAGSALLVLLLAVLAWQRWGESRLCLPLALAAGSALLFFTVGLARIGLKGFAYSHQPRYVYIAAGLLLPLVAVAFSQLPPRSVGRVAILPAVLVFVLALGLGTLDSRAHDEAIREQAGRGSLLAQAELVRSGATILRGDTRGPVVPDAAIAPDLVLSELVEMSEAEQLPTGVRLTQADRLAAISNLQLSLRRKPEVPRSTSSTPTILSVEAGVANPSGGNCISLAAAGDSLEVALVVPAPTSLSMRFETATSMSISLERDDIVAPAPRGFSLAANTRTNLNFAAGNLIAHLTLVTEGQTLICGIDPT